MAKGKVRSPQEKTEQKKRTYKNKVVRYEGLIEKFPESKNVSLWQKLVEFFKKG